MRKKTKVIKVRMNEPFVFCDFLEFLTVMSLDIGKKTFLQMMNQDLSQKEKQYYPFTDLPQNLQLQKPKLLRHQ